MDVEVAWPAMFVLGTRAYFMSCHSLNSRGGSLDRQSEAEFKIRREV